MSINVNVSGNPISIKRGKLITTDVESSASEFQKRRRIRLEQVRQQSKNIAENVRNKVRGEKSKQLSDIERQGEKELKKWQTRKLLSLQKQYSECLNDIGLGHAQAILEDESDIEWEKQQEDYKQLALGRGEVAAKHLDETKRKAHSSKTTALQKKQITKDIENTRSKMVANINKKDKSPFKKKKRKVSTDISISRRIEKKSETENDTDTEEPIVLNISETSSVSGKDNLNSLSKVTEGSTESAVTSAYNQPESVARPKSPLSVKRPKSPVSVKRPKSPILMREQKEPVYPMKNFDHYLNTQISDRIKNRMLKQFEPSNSNVCDLNLPSKYTSCCCGRQSHRACFKISEVVPEEENQDHDKPDIKQSKIENQIPSKPTVTLNPTKSASATSDLNKVQYCDFKNHYTKEYIPSQSTIERIQGESIQVCPTDRSEIEYVERMYKRDQDAQSRGKKALEKQKVHRDYKNMMQQLPALQKQERIASISSNKPKFHMSDDRLKEHDRKLQNRMENAYEKLFPKPRVITIPPKDVPQNPSNLPFQTISVNSNNPPIINVGSWDFDISPTLQPHVNSKSVDSELLQEALNSVLDNSYPDKAISRRQEQLRDMWRTLSDKRAQLAKEISGLPENSKLRSMLSEVGGIDQFLNMGEDAQKKVDKGTETMKSRPGSSRRKQSKERKVSSSSVSVEDRPALQKKDDWDVVSDKGRRYNCLCTVDSSSDTTQQTVRTSGKTKTRHKRPPSLILQNISTQTTPLVERSKATSPAENIQQVTDELAVSAQNGATSSSKPSESDEKFDAKDKNMCEIVIKIDDAGKPQVCVCPSKLTDKKIIVKTGIIRTNSPVTEQRLQSKPPRDVDKTQDSTKVCDTPKDSQHKKPTSQNKQKSSDKIKQDKSKNIMDDVKSHSTWNDYLSQNSTSTSTSYYSPPEISDKVTKAVLKKRQTILNNAKHHLTGVLKDKPQQGNIQNSATNSSVGSSNLQNIKDTTVCPLKCIKKLLTMSRQSIDDLQVSSVSNISTPGSSIIQTKTNITNQIPENTTGDNLIYNTVESVTSSSRGSNSPNNEQSTMKHTTLEEYCATNYPDVMAIYNKLAENCTKKIEYLGSLLEKNRLEKLSLISPSTSGSDKENSTKYMSLPPEPPKPIARVSKNNCTTKDNFSESAEQDELNQELLGIDYNLVERLKSMTPAEIKEQFPLSNLSVSDSSVDDSTDKALIQRFRDIVGSHSSTGKELTTLGVVPFTPLSVDVPSLLCLEVKPLYSQKHIERTKPPPSKGLTIAKRFNNNITSTPHQLSTIIESETLLSSRLHKSQTPDCSSAVQRQDKSPLNTSPQKMVELEGPAKACNILSGSKKSSSTDSVPDILTELMKDVQRYSTRTVEKPVSDTSSSDVETIEAMLNSLGMGSWALATLRKTQEALALPSSSSSLDNSSKHKITDSSSPSSESLIKQFAVLKSDESHGSSQFMKDLQDSSALDKATRRTSTPIQNSKSNDTVELEVSTTMSISDKKL